MESPDNSVTVETLCDYVEALDGDQRVFRNVSNNALLIPVESVFKLLHTSLQEVIRAARVHKPYLPVDKTFLKMLKAPNQAPSRGTLLRLLKEAPHRALLQAFIEQEANGYIWVTGEAWRSLFVSPLFIHQAARDFWIAFVRDAAILNAVDLHSDKDRAVKLRTYGDSPLVDRFGCSTVRATLQARLSSSGAEEIPEDDQIILRVFVADRLAVLMRILAWLVADMVVDIWEMIERDDMQDIVPFDSVLPAIDPATGEWNNPMSRSLEQLAKRAGWKGKQRATTFLGSLWDRHDPDGKQPGSRTRSMRNWEQRRKGRPKFETFVGLAHTVTVEQALLSNESPKGREYDSWMQAAILRIGETLSELLYSLNKMGVEAHCITGIMDAYREEYRFAREALGKPMNPT
jgi:hypothetical protein